ncbi:MAG: chorismate mutase [Pseudoalteromonas rhizosphaerae]
MLLSSNFFAASTAQELFSTINLRLSYMEDVASYKSNNNNQAIKDKEPRNLDTVIGPALIKFHHCCQKRH